MQTKKQITVKQEQSNNSTRFKITTIVLLLLILGVSCLHFYFIVRLLVFYWMSITINPIF